MVVRVQCGTCCVIITTWLIIIHLYHLHVRRLDTTEPGEQFDNRTKLAQRAINRINATKGAFENVNPVVYDEVFAALDANVKKVLEADADLQEKSVRHMLDDFILLIAGEDCPAQLKSLRPVAAGAVTDSLKAEDAIDDPKNCF